MRERERDTLWLLSCRRRHDVYQDGFGQMYPESSHHPPFHNVRQMAEVVYIIAAVAARLTLRAADSRYRRTNKHAFDNERKEIPLSHAQAIILKIKKGATDLKGSPLFTSLHSPPIYCPPFQLWEALTCDRAVTMPVF